VKVLRGPITETVSVTGNTEPISSVHLGFGSSGTIAHTYAAVGRSVASGTLLATLNTADIDAQIAQAEATLARQLAENKSTAVNVDQVKNQQDQLVSSAYTKLLSEGLIAVPDEPSYPVAAPTVSGRYTGPEGTYKVIVSHSSVNITLDRHTLRTFGIEKTGPTDVSRTTSTQLGTHGLSISFPDDLSGYDDTVWYVTIPNKTSSEYLANYNAYQAALDTREKAISDAEAQIAVEAEGTSVAEADLANARAALRSAESRRANLQIIAPISGVITQFDAKTGEFASPGTTLISIISQGSFQVEAQVSETDVGKIAVGNKVTMTLDAFPGETFTGSIFYIDPAQTTTEGVVGYKIKIGFDKVDQRLKSGLTANIDITTRTHDNVLFVPLSAVLQKDEGAFVEILDNGKPKDIPVTLGLSDEKGNVEIVDGVTAEEEIVNVGLKSK
jgi:RND family efflux transporter MFP subunit